MQVTDAIAPGYSKIIKHPMDFSTMARKIKLDQYSDIEGFEKDLQLMVENCHRYNQHGHIVYIVSIVMSRLK